MSADDGDESHKVNGSIHVPAGRVAENVKTVNGSINVEDNGAIATASTVNGGIKLGAHATGTALDTVNGSDPTIIIGPGATVQGELVFKRKVRLFVSDRATIGKVSGATAIAFAGDKPPP